MPRQSTAIGRSAAASRVISAEAAILRAVFGRGRKSSAANSARLRSANLLSVTEYLHALALGWRRAEGWAERPRGQAKVDGIRLAASERLRVVAKNERPILFEDGLRAPRICRVPALTS